MCKIAIFGGSGYIGYELAKYLSNIYQIKILDIKSPLEMNVDNIDFTKCDITKYGEVENGLNDIDLVINTAIIQIPLINENKKIGYAVNILGTQNVCRAIENNQKIKGMILAGTWHTIGEKELTGEINEEFGFRPDKVEDRARLYALSKMGQEAIVRLYDEISEKIFGIMRMGTVLGERMPEKTAANIFIERGLKGETITPYEHSMYRPMLYIDIENVCEAYSIYAGKILNNETNNIKNSLEHIFNIYYHVPITILELAEIIKNEIVNTTDGLINPKIEIVKKGIPIQFTKQDKNNIKINVNKINSFFKDVTFKHPKDSIKEIIQKKWSLTKNKM